jgi:hypothetical protein
MKRSQKPLIFRSFVRIPTHFHALHQKTFVTKPNLRCDIPKVTSSIFLHQNTMKMTIRSWALAAALSAFTFASLNVTAQDTTTAPVTPIAPGGPGGPGGGPGRNFDPAQFQQQMQQRMNEFLRQKLSVTNDDEWNVIQPLLNKVVQKRMEVSLAGMGGLRGMMGNRNRQGGGGGGPRGGFFGMGQPSPEEDALQQALDNNAPKEQVKTALENVRAARKRKADELAKSQDDLRQVLTLRQEAALVSLGMLD